MSWTLYEYFQNSLTRDYKTIKTDCHKLATARSIHTRNRNLYLAIGYKVLDAYVVSSLGRKITL